MSKIAKKILRVLLADDPEASIKQSIDEKKRHYVLGLGSVLSTLGACSAPVDPNAQPVREFERATGFDELINDSVDDNSTDGIDASIVPLCDDEDDIFDGLPGTAPGSCAGGTTPPPPGTGAGTTPPPGAGAGTTPPGTGTGTAPPPGAGAGTTPPPGTGTGTNPTPGAGTGTNPPPPGTDTGANPSPGTGSGTTNPPAPGIVDLPLQTYVALGPGLVNLDTTDMMNPNIVQVMADGNALQTWGFNTSTKAGFNGDQDRMTPGPVIEAIEGELTTIALRSQNPHTLHLHGLDVDQANDGVPSTSGFVSQMDPNAPGTPPGNRILNPPGVWLGNPYEYKFIAPHAGTYMYHCHVDTVLHMEMGMSGTIIVRPADGSRDTIWAGVGAPKFKREYIWQLHTFDSKWHVNPLTSGSITARYSPDYFMINGRDGENILTDTTAAIEAYPTQDILIRLINLGYQPAIIKLGGIEFDIVASDGRPLKALQLFPLTEMMIGPGERYDIMFNMPATGVTNATVDYLDIQGNNILGTAMSTITSL